MQNIKPIVPGQELLSRQQTAVILGNRCVASVIRLEKAGLLTPIKLGRSASAQTFYRPVEVRALIDRGANHAR